MMPSDALILENIAFSQHNRRLLSGISFTVAKGQILGLLGINGAGKSTTLKVTAGILLPDSGTITRPANWSLGYVPEIPPLIPAWTVQHFLSHMCRLHQLPMTHHNQAIKRVCELCELTSILLLPCGTLSKGNQQRVAIAQALLNTPDLLILDEPTSGLDPKQIHQFRQLLQRIKLQSAIVFSSHIMHEITTLCESAIVIHEGQQIGSLETQRHDKTFTLVFTMPVDGAVFAACPAWQSGAGKQHVFSTISGWGKNEILAYCLQQSLPIDNILNDDNHAEQAFLTLIEEASSHV